MSKRSLFWGNAVGKLGEAVFYRAGGEQRTRAYVAKIKNPKSLAQMENRISMNNVVSMFRAYQPILKSSFPKKPANQSGFNAFVSINKKNKPYAIMPEDQDSKYFYTMGYQISQGDVPILTSGRTVEHDNPFDEDATLRAGREIPGLMLHPVTVPVPFGDGVVAGIVSPKQLYELMTANGNPLGLPTSFKVTVLGGFLDVGYGEESANGAFSAAYVQYLCSPTASEFQGADIASGNPINSNRIQISIGGIENLMDGTAEKDGSEDIVSLMIGNGLSSLNELDMCVGIIVSYSMDGVQHVTNSTMIYGDKLKSVVESVSKGGSVWQDVLNTYGYNQESILATK